MSKKKRSFRCTRYCAEQLASCLKMAGLKNDPLERLALIRMAAHWRDFAYECDQKGHPWASWCQKKLDPAE